MDTHNETAVQTTQEGGKPKIEKMKSFSVVRQVVETSDCTVYAGFTRNGQQMEVAVNLSQLARNVAITMDDIAERKEKAIDSTKGNMDKLISRFSSKATQGAVAAILPEIR